MDVKAIPNEGFIELSSILLRIDSLNDEVLVFKLLSINGFSFVY
jgi:hypothetical protein